MTACSRSYVAGRSSCASAQLISARTTCCYTTFGSACWPSTGRRPRTLSWSAAKAGISTIFLALVEKNPKIRDHFHILNGINDATLDWLYRNCLFTVYPSLYEGWGLPVAEALNYGKVCVAARAGSVPEIAPEMTDLIDPLDFVTWYRTVHRLHP